MITEIAVLQLHTEANLADPSSSSSKILQDHLTQLLAAPGARYAYYGQSIEQPKTALLFVGWDDIGIHKEFMTSPYVTPFKTQQNLDVVVNWQDPKMVADISTI